MSKLTFIPIEEATISSKDIPELNDFMRELEIAFAMAEKEYSTCH
jgi:hypothetical protein